MILLFLLTVFLIHNALAEIANNPARHQSTERDAILAKHGINKN